MGKSSMESRDHGGKRGCLRRDSALTLATRRGPGMLGIAELSGEEGGCYFFSPNETSLSVATPEEVALLS